MKAVFDTKSESAYDDDIAHRYHFPPRYLETVSACVGDWVIFRQPRASGGSKAYFAVAKIARVDEDVATAGYFYAIVTDFLQFDQPVPWLLDGRYWETALRNLEKVSQLGLFLRGRSVRPLEEQDFADIVMAGLGQTLSSEGTATFGNDPHEVGASAVLVAAPVEERARRVVEMLINRKIRDACFRRSVCSAYGERCAVTGLRILDGEGRAEVQAAHVWPVADGGPDTVQNGIALSGTAHWLFDRHLIALTDDYQLLVAHEKVPSEFSRLLEGQSIRILLPSDQRLWPNTAYVGRHREAFARKL